jgi:beta-glucosidase
MLLDEQFRAARRRLNEGINDMAFKLLRRGSRAAALALCLVVSSPVSAQVPQADGRTYRFFKGQPLYPVGHGLSYTRFRYSGLNISAPRVSPTDKLTVSATVENVGRVEGDEVVQLYVTDAEGSVRVPARSLAGIERVHLMPGERRTVSFTVEPRQLAVIWDDGRAFVEPGEFLLSVGGKQPGFAGTADAATTSFVEGRFTVVGAPTEVKR